MTYKGDPIVSVGITQNRNEWGAWATTWEYQGTRTATVALANSLRGGQQANFTAKGAVCSLSITYGLQNPSGGAEVPFDRWEIDRENSEKHLIFSVLGQALSQPARVAFEEW